MDRPATAIDPDPLDAYLPHWHWRSRSTAIVPASAEAAFAALMAVTVGELPTVSGSRPDDPDLAVVDELREQGFVTLEPVRSSSLVLGRTGHIWRRGGPATDARGFAAFDRPGHAKSGVLFAARPYLDEAVVVTEVRLWANDPHTFRGFSRHWLVASWARELSQQQLVGALRRRLGVRRYTELDRHADGRHRAADGY
jgi:hypothetical protein